MLYNSKGVALLLSCLISFLSVLFLSLTEIPANVLIFIFIIVFTIAFISIYITLEILIFNQINKIYTGLNSLSRQQLELDKKLTNSVNPFQIINKQIFHYIKNKESEIDELKKLEAYRKEFIADISHELKTPVFSAQGYVHTLIDGGIEDPDVNYKFLEKAATTLDRLDVLVQDLLTLSQIESGVLPIHMTKFDICALVKEVAEEIEDKAARQEIHLYNMLPKKALQVYADEHKIRRVLINLIHNGIKYGRKGGWVKLSVIDSKKNVLIVIKDNGTGISKEHIDRIFERFYRVDKSRSKERGGTGLGLAIVKHILEGHSKQVMVKSKHGKGTVFSFSLDKNDK